MLKLIKSRKNLIAVSRVRLERLPTVPCENVKSHIIKCTIVDNYDLGAALKLYIAIVSLLVETFEQENEYRFSFQSF